LIGRFVSFSLHHLKNVLCVIFVPATGFLWLDDDISHASQNVGLAWAKCVVRPHRLLHKSGVKLMDNHKNEVMDFCCLVPRTLLSVKPFVKHYFIGNVDFKIM
jgi:hypothetical protein